MPYYELLCLAKGHLTRRELANLVTKTARDFMSQGGVVTRLHALGATGYGPRKLAYSIRRNQVTHKTGYFLNICAFASPSALKEVSRKLSINETVLRFLAFRKNAMAAVAPLPDIDHELPATSGDPNDPEFALREFIREYEKEFPEGQSIVASEDERDMDERVQNDDMVKAVMENLQATSQTASENSANETSAKSSNVDMDWLLNYSGDGKKPSNK